MLYAINIWNTRMFLHSFVKFINATILYLLKLSLTKINCWYIYKIKGIYIISTLSLYFENRMSHEKLALEYKYRKRKEDKYSMCRN